MAEHLQRPLRLGVIGCGNVLSAYRAAADKLKARGWAEFAMACGRESQRVNARLELGSIEFTTQPEDVIGAPEIDGVVILTLGCIASRV